MPTINEMATTFTLPQFGGELINLTPTETPFFSAIGGLSLDDPDLLVNSLAFDWQTEDLPAPTAPGALEGADATNTANARAGGSNIVQIFQYGVSVSYSRQGATAAVSTQRNPVTDELGHQIALKIPTAKRDMNYAFLNNTFNLPADNATPRTTRGLIPAITTNVTAAGGAALTQAMVLDMLQGVFTTRGIRQDQEPTLIVGAPQKRALSAIFITGANYQQQSRRVGGVNLQALETDFGVVNIMLERAMPADTVVFSHLRRCRPRFLYVPGKGYFFGEPLSKTGSADNYQIYGEAGLEYGHESFHAKITGLA